MDDSFALALARAEAHRREQRHAQAIEALSQAALLKPDDPRPHFELCMAQTASELPAAACASALRAVELSPNGFLGVLPSEATQVPKGVYPQIGLRAAVMAFDLLVQPVCDAVERPSWWSDVELLRMSARALADTPGSPYAISTRVRVLMGVGQLMADGRPRGWYLQQRSSADLRQLAELLKKQATIESPGSTKALVHLRNAAAILAKAVQLEAHEKARNQPPATADGFPTLT